MLKSAPWSLASESSFPKAPFGVLVNCSFARFLKSVEMFFKWCDYVFFVDIACADLRPYA